MAWYPPPGSSGTTAMRCTLRKTDRCLPAFVARGPRAWDTGRGRPELRDRREIFPARYPASPCHPLTLPDRFHMTAVQTCTDALPRFNRSVASGRPADPDYRDGNSRTICETIRDRGFTAARSIPRTCAPATAGRGSSVQGRCNEDDRVMAARNRTASHCPPDNGTCRSRWGELTNDGPGDRSCPCHFATRSGLADAAPTPAGHPVRAGELSRSRPRRHPARSWTPAIRGIGEP
jgi:hypothetical protein